jgi:hypothetical protein
MRRLVYTSAGSRIVTPTLNSRAAIYGTAATINAAIAAYPASVRW